MRRVIPLFPALLAIGIVASCGPSASDINRERQNRVEAQRRDIELLQASREEAIRQAGFAVQESQQERSRREFWQVTTFVAVLAAVILLVVGVAIGSRSKPHESNLQA